MGMRITSAFLYYMYLQLVTCLITVCSPMALYQIFIPKNQFRHKPAANYCL